MEAGATGQELFSASTNATVPFIRGLEVRGARVKGVGVVLNTYGTGWRYSSDAFCQMMRATSSEDMPANCARRNSWVLGQLVSLCRQTSCPSHSRIRRAREQAQSGRVLLEPSLYPPIGEARAEPSDPDTTVSRCVTVVSTIVT